MYAPAPAQFGDAFDRGPSGLGGWLVLPIIGLIGNALMVVARTFGSTIPDLQHGFWSTVTTTGSPYYHPAWAPLLGFEYLFDAIVLVCSVLFFILLLQKKPVVPRLMVGYYAFFVVGTAIDSLVVYLFGPDMLPNAEVREQVGWTPGALWSNAARIALMGAIWIPYFLMSKRVKNTFVERRRQPTAPAVAEPQSWG